MISYVDLAYWKRAGKESSRDATRIPDAGPTNETRHHNIFSHVENLARDLGRCLGSLPYSPTLKHVGPVGEPFAYDGTNISSLDDLRKEVDELYRPTRAPTGFTEPTRNRNPITFKPPSHLSRKTKCERLTSQQFNICRYQVGRAWNWSTETATPNLRCFNSLFFKLAILDD